MVKKSIEQFDEKNDEQVYVSVRETLESARGKVERAVNSAMVEAYWEIGRQIVEATGERAEYGKHLVQYLAERLTAEYGKGFTERNPYQMQQFYLAFPKVHTLCAQLSWSHYRRLMRIPNDEHQLDLADGKGLFASSYVTCLPTEEELTDALEPTLRAIAEARAERREDVR